MLSGALCIVRLPPGLVAHRGGSCLGPPAVRSRPQSAYRRAAMQAVPSGVQAEAEEAVKAVQRQLELYNAREVEPFMQVFAEDVIITDAVTGATIATGKEQLKPRYVERFKSPVYCELISRVVLGNVVVDREIITGLPDGGVADCMASYVVEGGLIKRAAFVWKPRTLGVKL